MIIMLLRIFIQGGYLPGIIRYRPVLFQGFSNTTMITSAYIINKYIYCTFSYSQVNIVEVRFVKPWIALNQSP